VGEWLERTSLVLKVQKVQKVQNTTWREIFHKKNTFFVHPAVNGCLALFRAGEDEGGEEEEWPPTSVTPLPGISLLFNSHFQDGP